MRQFLTKLVRNPATRSRLKTLPGVSQLMHASRRTRRAYYRRFGPARLRRLLRAHPRRRIVIGAWDRYDPGWIPTQREFLDLTIPQHWEVFEPNTIEALLAEHVWEHITEEEGRQAARTCYTHLRPGGYLRVAVPDGLLPDPEYVELVRAADGPVANNEGNAANHKALYTYRSLSDVFTSAGFRVVLYEYFDEAGRFHCQDWDRERGTIWRSKRFDPRNRNGTLQSVYPGTMHDYLSYSSIILDAVKD